jgi:hypothetical protein
MKRIIALTLFCVIAATPAWAQRKKRATKPKGRSASKAPAATPTPNGPRIVGSDVEIITKSGDHIVGEVLELTAYSIRIRADRLESTIAMDTIASLSFGGAPTPTAKASTPAPSPDFARDASIVLGSFRSVATNLQTGIDYTEFGRQVNELRRSADRLISKFAATDNITELRIISLIIAGLNDYNWSRTVWTLKFGRSSDGLAFETESSALVDVLAAYPDVKSASANGNKYGIDKVVGLLWQKAAEKSARARSLLAPAG